jgi:hypothetical protein
MAGRPSRLSRSCICLAAHSYRAKVHSHGSALAWQCTRMAVQPNVGAQSLVGALPPYSQFLNVPVQRAGQPTANFIPGEPLTAA